MPGYIVNITDEEQKILEHDLLDVEKWIVDAVQGKINNCMKRLAKAEQERLIQSGAEMMPTKPEALCKSAFACKEYKNRVAREKEILNKEVTKG